MRSTTPSRTNIVLTREHLDRVVEHFSEQSAFVFDVESMPPNEEAASELRGEPSLNKVVWIALATEGMTCVIPMGHPNGDVLVRKSFKKLHKSDEGNRFIVYPPVYDEPPQQLFPSEVFEALRPLFFGDKTIIAHNAPFDLASVAKYYDGKIPEGEINDTIVLQWLLDENMFAYGLKGLVEKRYKIKYDHDDVGKRIEIHPFWKVAHYAFMDAKYTWLLWKHLRPYINEESGLLDVFKLENDLTPVVTKMNMAGVDIDMEAIQALQVEMTELKEIAEAEIYRQAGRKFNINANQQLAEILFAPKKDGGQGIRSKFLTKGGKKKSENGEDLTWKDYSTSAETLENFKGNPLVDALSHYAVVNKLLGTYVEGYLGNAERPCRIHNGRIHGNFVQYGTVTGRLSSREPNLQNVPRPGDEDGDLGKKIRNLFIAPPGYVLVGSDYDQVEVRILAHFAGPGALMDGILAGLDPHSATAAGIYKIPVEEFMARKAAGDPQIKAMRQVAKGVNFAVIYGAGPEKVASMAGVSVAQAKKFMAQHEEMFPEVYRFKKKCLQTARSRRPPHICTLSGRKRRVRELHSKEWGIRGRAERQIINSLIQGSSGDITKMAMVYLDKILPPEMDLILTVHDELVIRAPEDRAEEAQALLKEAMLGEHIQSLVRVPITADSAVAKTWGAMK